MGFFGDGYGCGYPPSQGGCSNSFIVFLVLILLLLGTPYGGCYPGYNK